MGKLSRREFIKVISAASVSSVLPRGLTGIGSNLVSSKANRPNIFIFVFDAMSAKNLSVYGYQRPTTPYFEKIANRSIVYHSHRSGGNFTSPGTSTLLTGLYPWRTRAFTLGGLVDRKLSGINIFHLLGNTYHRIGYAQNVWADLFLRQFQDGIDNHIPITSFSSSVESSIIGQLFKHDPVIAYYSIDEFIASSRHFVNPIPGSLTAGFVDMLLYSSRTEARKKTVEYPYGKPFNGFYYYDNSTVFKGVRQKIIDATDTGQPIFGYFHFFSPHGPYAPKADYLNILPEINVPFKPRHPLSYSRISQNTLNNYRLQYDEYISNVDDELGKMMEILERSGILDNSYIILTSDHGEVFERGEYGHASALLYEPIIHVPLIISAPGQRYRKDVFYPTSNVDILPTVLEIAGMSLPDNLDGKVLPELGGDEDVSRPLFALDAKENSAFLPLSKATIAMIKGNKKLVYYLGYPKYSDVFEMYDLTNDRDEVENIYNSNEDEARSMSDELRDNLSNSNQDYVKH